MSQVRPAIRRSLPFVLGVVLLAALALAAWTLSRPAPEVLQGDVEATQVSVSSKFPGRVGRILVREGDTVKKGAPLVVLESPEIGAKLEQAEASVRGAAAQQQKADRGAREEEIRAAKGQWERARAAVDYASKTFGRLDRLARDGVVPVQRRDEAEAGMKSARAAEEAAKAILDMAVKGTRVEDKETATALVQRAEGAVSEVQAVLADTTLAAPIDGEVAKRNLEPGELTSAGFPVLTLVDLSDEWVVFQIREDRLGGVTMGTLLHTRVPALGGKEVSLKVTYIARQADFATWRATSAQGGFDLKTFEVHARPDAPVPGLRPGMTVVAPLPLR